MNFQAVCNRCRALDAGISSILIAIRCLVRGLPLFIAARPKTPLRVLCIAAFDMLHRLRHAKPLPAPTLRNLAALLDFGACANAAFDHKRCCRRERRRTLRLMEQAGLRSSVDEYVRRLRELESRRPWPGGDEWQFQKVRLYREDIVRLSLGMIATTAVVHRSLDEGIHATDCDADLHLLFRIVMQCQVIDDVFDYSEDLSAGLPSFLTATTSLAHACELTHLAALDYADDRDLPRRADLLPLRSALWLLSACTRLVIVVGHWWPGRSPKSIRVFVERTFSNAGESS